MLKAFVAHIRPIMDYASSLWNVGYVGDVKRLEAVQRRWTKHVEGCWELAYPERLRTLGLYSVYGRMLRADLIKVWKAFYPSGVFDSGLSSIFEVHGHRATRGHSYKLSVPVCRTELKRRFFSVRCVRAWNELPESVVGAVSVGGFKSGLDREMGHLFCLPVGGE